MGLPVVLVPQHDRRGRSRPASTSTRDEPLAAARDRRHPRPSPPERRGRWQRSSARCSPRAPAPRSSPYGREHRGAAARIDGAAARTEDATGARPDVPRRRAGALEAWADRTSAPETTSRASGRSRPRPRAARCSRPRLVHPKTARARVQIVGQPATCARRRDGRLALAETLGRWRASRLRGSRSSSR